MPNLEKGSVIALLGKNRISPKSGVEPKRNPIFWTPLLILDYLIVFKNLKCSKFNQKNRISPKVQCLVDPYSFSDR